MSAGGVDCSAFSRIKDCVEVGPCCRVENTVLGYYPNLGSGYFFTIAFGICLVGSIVLGAWKRTWTFSAALVCGLILETAGKSIFSLSFDMNHDKLTTSLLGYVGRIQLSSNPFNEHAFELQICTIILAPTFLCAAIYLTLKHVALALSPELSRIPAAWYPRVFLPADLSCLIVQAIGGGIAAAAGHTKPALQRDGNRAIIAGIVLQVLVLGFFGFMGADYFIRVGKFMRTPEAQGTEGLKVWRDRNFRIFAGAVSAAYSAVMIRCIYR